MTIGWDRECVRVCIDSNVLLYALLKVYCMEWVMECIIECVGAGPVGVGGEQ